MVHRPPLLDRLFGVAGRVAGLGWRYAREYEYAEDREGLQLLRRAWRAGHLGRLGIASLLAGVALCASRIASPDAGATLATTVAGAGLFALGWAFALAASVRLPLWGYLLVAAYLDWHGLFIGGSLAGTPIFALPTLWMLLLGARMARARGGSRPWLLLLCLGSAYLTYGAFGLSWLFRGDRAILAPVLLGPVYFAALSNPRAARFFARADGPPRADRVFWGTLVVVGAFLTLGILRDREVAERYTLLTMRGLLGFVDLFWFWLGASLFQGAVDLGRWVTDESVSLLPARAARILFLVAWICVGIFGWLTTHDVPVGVAVFAHQVGLGPWVMTWSDADYWALYCQVFASAAAVGALIVLVALRRFSHDRFAWLNGLWLATWIGVVGFWSSFEAFGTLEADASEPILFWTGLTLVGGLVWEMARSNARWPAASDDRILALTSWLLLMLGACVVTLGAGLPEVVMEYTLYSFLGVVYLGLPLTVYDIACDRGGHEPLPLRNLLGLFAIGATSASLVLGIDPFAGAHLLLAPVVWAAGLALWGGRLARLDGAFDGLVAGSAMALGFVTFWMFPQALPIPFCPPWQRWQDRYMLVELNRPLLLAGQWWLTLISLAAGMAVGWTSARCRRRRPHGAPAAPLPSPGSAPQSDGRRGRN